MSSAELLQAHFIGDAPVPGPPGLLRGSLVIRGPYRYDWTKHDPYTASLPDNPVFLDELDMMWTVDAKAAESIFLSYLARGYTEVVSGPAVANGYARKYPDTNWLGASWPRYLEFLRWMHATAHAVGVRLSVTYVALPDIGPWFDGTGRGWDMPRCRLDFSPIYRNREFQSLIDRVQLEWEQWGSTRRMAEAFEWVADVFGPLPVYFHNGVGHLSPGRGDEDEQESWRSAARLGCRGILEQTCPVNMEIPGDPHGRTHLQQHAYDLWDMQRRFLGSCPPPAILAHEHLEPRSPWGAPVTSPDGTPLEVIWREGVAYALWHRVAQEDLGVEWATVALSVQSVAWSGDGGGTGQVAT